MYRTVGRYTVVKLIHEGLTYVYLARDPSGRYVVLKLPRRRGSEQTIANEARILRALALHPYIPRLIEFGHIDRATPFIAIEYIAGYTPPKLDVDTAIVVTLCILIALDHMHTRHVVHCDIKPSNIIVGLYRPIAVLDYGIAVFLGEKAIGATQSYAAPEQMKGVCTFESDIYSAFTTMFSFVNGRPPTDVRELREFLESIGLPHIARHVATDRPATRIHSAKQLLLLSVESKRRLLVYPLCRYEELGQRLDTEIGPFRVSLVRKGLNYVLTCRDCEYMYIYRYGAVYAFRSSAVAQVNDVITLVRRDEIPYTFAICGDLRYSS